MRIFRRQNPPLTILSIALFVWTIWLTILGFSEALSNLIHHWQIALTMVFGSMVAGATSLGGGAVAFSVLTKLLHITPHDAKVFGLAIQSVGMTSASLAIVLTGIKVEWRVIRWGSLGGIFGISLGLGVLAPILPPDVIKMSFTLMLTSFGITLLALNRGVRDCHSFMPIWTQKERDIVIIAGFLGGIMSGLVGNGIDIFVFAAMVLLFRISEKISTPTSVILMAVNSVVGLFLKTFILQEFTDPVVNYWLAAIPVVVVGAPLGAMICNLLHRQTIANILIALIVIELVSSLLLIPLRPAVLYTGVTILGVCSYLNYWMYSTPVYQNLDPWE